MDYPCGKFGDCSFSRFCPIMQINRQTHTQTDAVELFTFTADVSINTNVCKVQNVGDHNRVVAAGSREVVLLVCDDELYKKNFQMVLENINDQGRSCVERYSVLVVEAK